MNEKDKYASYEEVLVNDEFVQLWFKEGRSKEDLIVELVNGNKLFVNRILFLENALSNHAPK